MSTNNRIILFASRWGQYLVFWGISFFILTRYFSYKGAVQPIDLIYTTLFHISIILAVIVNSFLLIPEFLAKQKYLLYSLLLIFTLASATWVNIITFRYIADWIFPGYYFISYYAWTDIIQFIIIYVALTTLLQLSRSWFREAEIKQELAEARRQHTETELKALRAQINPHFLFNSLNHIYALAVQKSPKTAPAILKLSDLLRYAIRSIDQPCVPLAKEFDYIREYIALFKTRIQHPERIYVSMDEPDADLNVTPLLLIIFVENCFKHGSISNPDECIKIAISVKNSTLILETQNVIDSVRNIPEESTGLGLTNVKRRLNLLYPKKHALSINRKDNIFTTKLTLNLS